MNTQCKQQELEFQDLNRKKVVVRNDGNINSSDSGLLMLREIENRWKLIERLAKCFKDYRIQDFITYRLQDLLKQRIFGICQGYEDLNDHEQWRNDPLLALACNLDPKTHILSGKSTLNRLELPSINPEKDKYKKITYRKDDIKDLIIEIFQESYQKEPRQIIIDIDATDDPLHGNQEGRFFHGYYDRYCYLPLYAFVDGRIILAELMTADKDPGNSSVSLIRYLIYKLREKWKRSRIILRGDSGFCRNAIMDFCESMDNVYYVIGLSRNKRLRRAIDKSMKEAKTRFLKKKEPQRVFKDMFWKTKTSWKNYRRVIGKAEYLEKGENARFIVTNLARTELSGKELYEAIYCGRGDMENRIKEQQLYLFADRTSTHYMVSNQLRLYYSTFAYIFFTKLREEALSDTEMKNCQCSTIRLKLMKVAAAVKISCRRIYVSLPYSFPYWDIWIKLHKNIAAA